MTEALSWYAVQVYSGFEKKVADSIREKAKEKGFNERIPEILVPVEHIVEVKKGEKISSERNFFPGYVFVNMVMADDTWHLIKNIPKVSGFLGGKGTKPVPIRDAEAQRIKSQVEERKNKPKHTLNFDIGESVRISEGAFSSFNGLVEEIDEEKEKLKVSVLIFGRATPVDLLFSQVEKVK